MLAPQNLERQRPVDPLIPVETHRQLVQTLQTQHNNGQRQRQQDPSGDQLQAEAIAFRRPGSAGPTLPQG